MTAPNPVYETDHADALADLRALVGTFPEALYADARRIAAILGCPEEAAEEARRWIAEDGLEVLA
jgi:hypothetical protein